MDSYGNRSLHSLMDTETMTEQQSPNIHLRVQTHIETSDQDLQFTSPRPSTSDGTTMFPMVSPTMSPTPCPESPWTLSPLQSPSPSLLYQCIASLHRHEGNIYAISTSKGLIFTGSNSSRIRVWKQPDCMDRGHLRASYGDVRAILAYSNMLFSTHKDCLAYYHSEGLLYSGSHDRTVKAWRVSDTKCVDSFVAHDDNINSILVNQDDGCLFTCSSDGSVKIWRRLYTEDSHTLTMTLKFQPSPVNALALSSSFNHCFLYSGSSDGMINFWEKERLCYRFNHGGFLQGHHFAVLCLAAVGNMVFSGSEDTTIRVWRREEGSCYHECLNVLEGHRGPVKCLCACLEMEKVVMGFLVYSTSLDQTFKVWRIKVLAEEKVGFEECHGDQGGGRVKDREYDMSPVLSPSWVEKKLQGSHFQ